jgi:hypothetical protein
MILKGALTLSVLRLVEAEPSLIGMSQNFVAIAALPANDREVELDRDLPR